MLDQAKLSALVTAISGAFSRLAPVGRLIDRFEISEVTGNLFVYYSDNDVEDLGTVVGQGQDGTNGISVINVQLGTDPLRPGDVFFNIELSNGIILQTTDSIAGYNGFSLQTVRLVNNEFIFTLEDGTELEPIPIAGLTPVSVVGARIDAGELIFILSNGTEISAGMTEDLRGVGVAGMTFLNGVLSVTYTDNPTPVTLGTIKGIETLTVLNAELIATFNTDPATPVKISDFIYFTGAEVVGNELILITNQAEPNNRINLGPVANLKGDTGRGVSSVGIVPGNLLRVTYTDTTFEDIPVSGLSPISIVGARYDVPENEIYFILSDDSEIPSGIGMDFTGDDGRGIVDIELLPNGVLQAYFTDAPTTPVQVGLVPAILDVFMEDSHLKLRYNTDPDTKIDLGLIKSIQSIANVNGAITVTYSDGTSASMGNVKSVSSLAIVNGNLQVNYSDNTSAALGNIIGPQGVGFSTATVDPAGDLIILKTNGEQFNAGNVRQTVQNLMGDIHPFLSEENQVEYILNHSGQVLFFAGSSLISPADYDATQLDRITLTTSLPTGTAVNVVTFVDTGFVVTSKGVSNVTEADGVYTVILEDSTEYIIDTNRPIDPSTLPPGVSNVQIVNNRLIVTLTNGQALDAGETATVVQVVDTDIRNGILFLIMSDETELEVGPVVGNLTVENVYVDEATGHLIIVFTGNQVFDAGVAGIYVTGSAIVDGDLEIYLSNGNTINAGTVINPLIGQVFDFICFEGQYEFNVTHSGYQVLVYVNGSCLVPEDIDLTTPLVRVVEPRNETDVVRIVLLSAGEVVASNVASMVDAPDETFYGKRGGVLGPHGLNLTMIGKPYRRIMQAGQTTITDVYHNGQIMMFKNNVFVPLSGYTLPPDNKSVVLNTPATLNDEITIIALNDPTPMGDFKMTNHCNFGYQTNGQGGTFSAGAWRTRSLNALFQNGLGVLISNNRVVLDAGIYYIRGWAACQGVRANALRLFNTTSGTDLLLGPSCFSSIASSSTSVGPNSHTPIEGYFVLTAQSAIQVQHKGLYTKATNGFGAVGGGVSGATYTQSDLGMPARLVDMHLWKVG